MKVIEQGNEVLTFCDISVQLNALKAMQEVSAEWDTKYEEVRKADKSDGKKLAQLLKEA